ncbi:Gfo/Idh/MocA family protein [Nitratireductor sp. ZSWI3]|uniref:Gfo/Idh/MocA family protein n=1 Tax=Nitratireductor sp. ZSWI3 TaxID=2966359 RepID=UPI00214F6A03|nr:Gfo/Idh/MocA family oxidoreductase [Nitratireductor sp. ZSWI3]MCR4265815.1 Gfo/Idh/MocA family oxidoreductase [Nitratireductor sp. ZSWI3]
MSEKPSLNWGLIGASNIAREWMHEAISQHPDCRVVSVFTSSEERGEAFKADLGIARYYTELDAFLSDPELDAVYISTTNNRHCAEVMAAAKAGKHILCEKPLAMTYEDAEAMVAATVGAGVVLATNHHLRNMETHRTIKAIIDSGEIGDVTSARFSFTVDLPDNLARWRLNDPSLGAGVLLDLTVHDLDTLRYYFGHDPVRVSGIGLTTGADTPEGVLDNTTTVWEFPGKVLVICHDSFLVPYGGTAVEIHGTEGSISGEQILWQKPQGKVYVTTKHGKREINFNHAIPYHRTVSDFVNAVRGKGVPSASGRDGADSLRLVLAAREALATGRTVEISASAKYAR